METLQKVVRSSSQPISGPNKEACGYAGGQGSPTPGETASPQNYFQQSPSLPTSGLTEFNSASSTNWDPRPNQPSELPGTRAFTSSAPPKKYMGVRVKMPVCELLKKIRHSKGIDSNGSKETLVKAETKATLSRPGRKRVSSQKCYQSKRYNSPTDMKSVEDLDILVEVLEEDLSNSCSKLELRVPQPHWDHAHPRFQPHWWETESSQQLDGNHSGNSWDSTKFHQPGSLPDSGVLWHGWSKHLDGFDDRVMKLHLDPITVQPHSCMEARQHVQRHNPFPKSLGNFQGFAEEFGHHCRKLPGNIVLDPLENDSTALQGGGQLKPNSGALAGQDTSNVSLFHFQLYQEESRLRRIPQERLFEPDTNGSSLLHKATAQGRRVLAYALAWRLALQDRIDQEDALRQTALHVAAQRNYHLIVSDLVSLGANVNKRDESGKTPLHLCAGRGYPRVLEVLKNCQRGGTRLEVDATDNEGLTPLQCAAFAHSAIVMNLEKSSLSPEVRTLLTLRKDQLQCGMACLLEMGAEPGGQETKSPSQSSSYAAKVQENSKLMSFLHVQRPQRQEDSATVPGPDGRALSCLQGVPELPLPSFAGIFQDFPEGTL